MQARWIKPALIGLGAFLGVFTLAKAVSDPSCPAGSGSGKPGSGKPLDPYAPHEPATSFEATAKPGAKLFRRWILGLFGERSGSPENISRWDRPEKPSEHHEGRAWDVMTTSKDHGQKIVDFLLAPDSSGNPHALARRAGVMYMIWQRQMWRAYPWQGKPAGTWGPYTGENPHTDHVHFSFSKAGGNGETSLYDDLRRDFPSA